MEVKTNSPGKPLIVVVVVAAPVVVVTLAVVVVEAPLVVVTLQLLATRKMIVLEVRVLPDVLTTCSTLLPSTAVMEEGTVIRILPVLKKLVKAYGVESMVTVLLA